MYFLPNDSKWYQSLASVKPAHRYWYTSLLLVTITVISYVIYSYFLSSSALYAAQLQAVQKQLDVLSNAQTHSKQLESKKADQLKIIEQHKTQLQSKQVKDVIALVQEAGITLEKCSLAKQISKNYYHKQPVELTMNATIEQLERLSKKLSQQGLSLSNITMSATGETKNYQVTASVSLYEAKNNQQ